MMASRRFSVSYGMIEYPHDETDIGLWLIANGTVDAEDVGHPDRLFNASDPVETDLGGRFAFVIPK